jgi:hypothetical protein
MAFNAQKNSVMTMYTDLVNPCLNYKGEKVIIVFVG